MLAEELPHLYLCFSSSLGVAMRLISSQNTLEHICPLTHATAANSFSPYFWRALIAAIVHFVWLFALFSSIPLLLMLGDSFQKTAYECKELKSCVFLCCFSPVAEIVSQFVHFSRARWFCETDLHSLFVLFITWNQCNSPLRVFYSIVKTDSWEVSALRESFLKWGQENNWLYMFLNVCRYGIVLERGCVCDDTETVASGYGRQRMLLPAIREIVDCMVIAESS